MLITIIVFLLILSVLVLVHEAGHFIAAKFFKIKVEEFGFGLPPRAFGIKRGETLYSINWLPIGGFVKLYGEDEAGAGRIQNSKFKIQNKDKDRAFFAKPLWQRAIVIVAGVFMNFVLAVVILSFLFSYVGVPVQTNKVVIGDIVRSSPADKAGLKTGDIIEAIKGQKITEVKNLIDLTKNNAGQKLNVDILTKSGEKKTVILTPRTTYPKNEGPMGVAIAQEIVTKKYPWYEAPFVGVKEALTQTWMIASGLGTLLTQLVTKGVVPSDVAGPVGIAQLTGRVVDIGLFAVLSFVSLLSLNLALINILPIPALDGGRLLFIMIEAVTRKKVSPVIENYAHTIGMVILLGLIGLITLHDLIRLFTGQPILPK